MMLHSRPEGGFTLYSGMGGIYCFGITGTLCTGRGDTVYTGVLTGSISIIHSNKHYN